MPYVSKETKIFVYKSLESHWTVTEVRHNLCKKKEGVHFKNFNIFLIPILPLGCPSSWFLWRVLISYLSMPHHLLVVSLQWIKKVQANIVLIHDSPNKWLPKKNHMAVQLSFSHAIKYSHSMLKLSHWQLYSTRNIFFYKITDRIHSR